MSPRKNGLGVYGGIRPAKVSQRNGKTSRRLMSKSKSKSRASSSEKGSTTSHSYSANIFAHHQEATEENGDATTNDTPYEGPDKIPFRPVFCGPAKPFESALLVRMVGEPSLLTRYETVTLQQIVVDAYNDWVSGICDGFHRRVEQVELKPIENLVRATQVHQETLMHDYRAHGRATDEGDEQDEEVSQQKNHVLVEAEDLNDREHEEVEEEVGTKLDYDDSSQNHRPLYWLSVSATCRNCPKTSQGNSNLLASHAGNMFGSRNSTHRVEDVVTADDMILEEICFCPIPDPVIERGVTNVTNLDTVTVDAFFPDAQAPTSMMLLDMINNNIQALRDLGKLVHVNRLVQLTEPDYAYYAEEMSESFSSTDSSITAIDGPPYTESNITDNLNVSTVYETHSTSSVSHDNMSSPDTSTTQGEGEVESEVEGEREQLFETTSPSGPLSDESSAYSTGFVACVVVGTIHLIILMT